MTGFQKLFTESNITAREIASDLNIKTESIYQWNYDNHVPNKHLKYLAQKFNVDEEYINKQVNDINFHQPRKRGFNEYKIDGETTIIYITKKNGDTFECLIDTEDLDKVKNYRWHMHYHPECKNPCYVGATIYIDAKHEEIRLMHSIIMNVDRNVLVDHIDNDPLNNRKLNLRVIPKRSNTTNRNGANRNNKSGYRNVFWNTRENCWTVSIRHNHKTLSWNFNDVDIAGTYAEKMRNKYYGEFAGRTESI